MKKIFDLKTTDLIERKTITTKILNVVGDKYPNASGITLSLSDRKDINIMTAFGNKKQLDAIQEFINKEIV